MASDSAESVKRRDRDASPAPVARRAAKEGVRGSAAWERKNRGGFIQNMLGAWWGLIGFNGFNSVKWVLIKFWCAFNWGKWWFLMMMIYSLYFLGGWLLSIILGISASAFWTLHGEICFFNQGFWAKWLDGQTFTPILLGGLEPWNFMTFQILGISSSQLTFTPSFFRG